MQPCPPPKFWFSMKLTTGPWHAYVARFNNVSAADTNLYWYTIFTETTFGFIFDRLPACPRASHHWHPLRPTRPRRQPNQTPRACAAKGRRALAIHNLVHGELLPLVAGPIAPRPSGLTRSRAGSVNTCHTTRIQGREAERLTWVSSMQASASFWNRASRRGGCEVHAFRSCSTTLTSTVML